jgi:hypothetical protein
VLVCERWPCAGEVAEHTVRQDSPSCPKKCDSNATAPHNVFADDKYALRRSRSPGGPCVVRDSLLNATGSECAVQCTARRRARRHSDGVQRYTFTGGEVSTFEDEESIQVSLCGNATPLWHATLMAHVGAAGDARFAATDCDGPNRRAAPRARVGWFDARSRAHACTHTHTHSHSRTTGYTISFVALCDRMRS